MIELERLGESMIEMLRECKKATEEYGKFNSTHEGISVIREEYLELEKEVFKNPKLLDLQNHKEKMREEAIQVGAMVLRFLVDFS